MDTPKGQMERSSLRHDQSSIRITLSDHPLLEFDATVDTGHSWHLQVFIDNNKVFGRLLEGRAITPDAVTERNWQHIAIDLGQ